MKYKKCFKCGLTKSVDEFWRQSGNREYFRGACKSCLSQATERIPLSEVQPYLREIIFRCGSEGRAAERLGIHKKQLRIWLGKQKRYYKDGSTHTARRIHKNSARRVFATLLELRAEGAFYNPADNRGYKPPWFNIDNEEAEKRQMRRKREVASG